MSVVEFERFVADLDANPDLGRAMQDRSEQPDPPGKSPIEGLVALAAAKGYDFTVDEAGACLRKKAEAQGNRLTDDQLDTIAGGEPFTLAAVGWVVLKGLMWGAGAAVGGFAASKVLPKA